MSRNWQSVNPLCNKNIYPWPLKFLLGDYSEKWKVEILRALKFVFSKCGFGLWKSSISAKIIRIFKIVIGSVFEVLVCDNQAAKDFQMSYSKLTYMINFSIASLFFLFCFVVVVVVVLIFFFFFSNWCPKSHHFLLVSFLKTKWAYSGMSNRYSCKFSLFLPLIV